MLRGAAGFMLSVVSHRLQRSQLGIPDEARANLFEEFFRAPNAKALDPLGTGLGLAIVKAIADRCGLKVDIDSAEGRGTTVTVQLPLALA